MHESVCQVVSKELRPGRRRGGSPSGINHKKEIGALLELADLIRRLEKGSTGVVPHQK
jgi:hypothetical protein